MTSTIKKYPNFSQVETSVSAVSIGANATKWQAVPRPTDHTAIAVIGYYLNGTNANNVTIYSIGAGANDSTNIALKNNSNSTVTFTLTLRWLCVD